MCATWRRPRSPTGSSPSASASSAFNAFAVHLPRGASASCCLMLLGVRWARQAFGERAALYTGLAVLTSAGVFLFTRIFLPDVLLSLLLAAALYCLLQSLAPASTPGAPRLDSETWEELPQSMDAPFMAQSHHDHEWEFFAKARTALLRSIAYAHVDRPRPRRPHQGPGRPRLPLRHCRPLPRPHRRTTATGAACKPVLRQRCSFSSIAAPWHILAGLRNTAWHRRPRLLLVLLHQRARPPLPRPPHPDATTTSSPAISTGASTSSGSSHGRSSSRSCSLA
jgi:hypothetical protein